MITNMLKIRKHGPYFLSWV